MAMPSYGDHLAVKTKTEDSKINRDTLFDSLITIVKLDRILLSVALLSSLVYENHLCESRSTLAGTEGESARPTSQN